MIATGCSNSYRLGENYITTRNFSFVPDIIIMVIYNYRNLLSWEATFLLKHSTILGYWVNSRYEYTRGPCGEVFEQL